ncbi:phage recombination protein Bet [Glutamicibacter ardleyensis]|uniref:Phage recombination protein Bet n=1 Tax=Glutamicibacter ardleyensis TaxID=225894 RepID=A0ABQ2DFZ0_9MICC|nr:phage recombination protein Bet [Glutamicibacter ardleyensis]GGJ56207.1 hypothetical protein GCM10007173_13770 [Glutamicibacter ardleyensis]
MSEVATQTQTTALAISATQTEFNEAQVATLSQLGLAGADRSNLAVFFHQSKKTGLDPFAKQIYMIGRQAKERVQNENGAWIERYVTKYTIQTGIDGYRLLARRGATQAKVSLSVEDTQWCGADGVWVDVWLHSDPPLAAKVTVWRGAEHFSAVALWSEYVQTYYNKKVGEHTPNSMWQKMPTSQLAKCAEAAALRKAFPLDLSGIYTDEEMPSVDGSPAPEIVDEGQATITPRIRTQRAPEPAPEEPPVEETTPEPVEPPADVVEEEPQHEEPALPDTGGAAGHDHEPADPPASDPWTDGLPEAPAETAPEPAEAEPTPVAVQAREPEPTATKEQMNQINGKLKTMGVTNKEQASTMLSNFAGRQIDHSRELTVTEANSFLERTS